MGKALVIRGADFSANSIGQYVSAKERFVQLLNEKLESRFTLGHYAPVGNKIPLSAEPTTTSDIKRARVWSVDMSEFLSVGLSEATLSAKSGWQFIFLMGYELTPTTGEAIVYSGDKTENVWNWYTGTITAPFSTANSKLFLHVRKADNSDLPATLTTEDIFDAIDIK